MASKIHYRINPLNMSDRYLYLYLEVHNTRTAWIAAAEFLFLYC